MSAAERLAPYRANLEAALAYGGHQYTFDDVAAAVDAGTMQDWCGPGSVMITTIEQAPQERSVFFFLAGGNLAELEAMEPKVIDWARTQGCTNARFLGRRGWERTFLTRAGWEVQPLVVLEKALV